MRGVAELLQVPARRLHRDVVEGGLEAGGRGARDGVAQLGEVMAEGELGRDVGQRIAGRLGGGAELRESLALTSIAR